MTAAERRADELERLLAHAIERELAARRTGAVHLQEIAMNEIRALRLLLQMPGRGGRSITTTLDTGTGE